MATTNAWLITPKTNLHVGNENASSYGLIDLEIQRDALTNLPCINSSSLKGAIREYARSQKMDDNVMIKVFGSDSEKKNSAKGGCNFFDATIIALPRPTDNLYELVYCKKVVDRCIEKAALFGITLTIDKLGLSTAREVSTDVFTSLCSNDNLPIIARNVLDNGTSKNLWYEQVLPAESILFTITNGPEDILKTLSDTIDNEVIQIGANATIGYGFCKIHKL